MNLPVNIPALGAKLPEVYQSAKSALAQCARIDECKAWADKAAALASYAKQSEDKSLEKMARRIRVRALDRVGEVMRQIESDAEAETRRKSKLKHAPRKAPAGPTSRDDHAKAAGLSAKQIKTALRVNNVPRDEFEKAVESDDPPTATELAERGRRKKPKAKPIIDIGGRTPDEIGAATAVMGALGRLYDVAHTQDPARVVRGFFDHERQEFSERAEVVLNWVGQIHRELGRL